MALQNFVDKLGPAVSAAFLNGVDQAINGTTAAGQGAYLIPANPSALIPGVTVGTQLDQLSAAVGGGTGVVNSFSAGNRIINPTFRISQRYGTTGQTVTAGAGAAYFADRYYVSCTGNNLLCGRGFGTAPIADYFFISNAGATASFAIGQRIESANIYDVVNQTASFSCAMSINTGSIVLTLSIYTASAFDNWAGRNLVGSTTFTVSSATFATFGYAFTVPAGAINGLSFEITGSTLAAGQTVSFTNVATVPGSSVLSFLNPSYGADFAACQRYLYGIQGSGVASQGLGLSGYASSTTTIIVNVPFPVQPRIIPTGISVNSSANFTVNPSGLAVSSMSLLSASLSGARVQVNVAGATANIPYELLGTAAGNAQLLFTGPEL